MVKTGESPSEFVHEYVSVLPKKLKHRVKMEQIVEEEALEEIARSKTGIPESFFAACKGLRRFVREKEDEPSF
jgi:hypothetical protein